MTKTNFETIARILKQARQDAIANGEAPLQVSDVTLGLADYFTVINPCFDRNKFLTAAGL